MDSTKKSFILLSALRLFAKKGYHSTKIADIAKDLDISVGSIYDYFTSKKSLAKACIKYATHKLATSLKEINDKNISQKEKIKLFVQDYFLLAQANPEMIEYFFRIYLSNREIFCDEDDCGFALAKEFVNEVRRLVEDGVKKNEFKEHSFCIVFSSIMGILCAMTYLEGENALEKELVLYTHDIANAINRVLF